MKKIELVEIRQVNDALAEMVALFRVELRSYKGIASKPNVCQRRVPPAGSRCRTAWQGRRNCSFLWKRYGLQLCPSQ